MARVSLLDDDEDEVSVVPDSTTTRPAGPVLLGLHEMQPNPENPRAGELELAERAADMKERGQLQNVNVMTLARFREVKPYLADRLTGAPYVVINGCVRLEAAPLAGLSTLRYELRDAWDADALDEAVIAENEQRTQLNPLLLGRHLARMLESPKYKGPDGTPSQRKLAEALSKGHPWVGQRIGLTRLHPDLQALVERNEITFWLARECVRLHPELQPALAAGELPHEVAKAWVVTLRLDSEEQMRRWQAGAPFDVTPVKELQEELKPVEPKVSVPRPQFVLRIMDRSPSSIADGLLEALDEDEIEELVTRLGQRRPS